MLDFYEENNNANGNEYVIKQNTKNTEHTNHNRGIKFVTDKVILHRPHLCHPFSYSESIPPKYSISVIIPKDDAENIDNLNTVIEKATELGVKKFGESVSNPSSPRLPIKDGDDGTTGDIAYINSFYFTVSSPIKPGIVDKNRENIFKDNAYFELRYARVSMNLIPYNMNGQLGISFRLNHIQIFPEKFDISQNMSSPQDDFS